MRERRRARSPDAWRSLELVLIGALLGSVAGGIVRASGPMAGCAIEPGITAQPPVRELPPEWRWTPPGVSLDRLYGTRRDR